MSTLNVTGKFVWCCVSGLVWATLSGCADTDRPTVVVDLSSGDSSGIPSSRAHAIEFCGQLPDQSADAAPPTCSIDGDGRLLMTYAIDCSDRPDGGIGTQWNTCTFAFDQDFSSFDPDEGASGVLAASFYIESVGDGGADGQAGGALDVWYDRGDGQRRSVSIFGPSDVFAPGCMTKFWGPDDVCSMGTCGATGCANAGPDAACPSYRSSNLELTSEYCTMSSNATIRLDSMTYYPRPSTCTVDADCPYPQVCRRDGWWPDAHCLQEPSGCPGVCAE